jgi:hypothetical protein
LAKPCPPTNPGKAHCRASQGGAEIRTDSQPPLSEAGREFFAAPARALGDRVSAVHGAVPQPQSAISPRQRSAAGSAPRRPPFRQIQKNVRQRTTSRIQSHSFEFTRRARFRLIQMKSIKVMCNIENIMSQEFQHCLESQLTEVMKMKMHPIQFAVIANLIQVKWIKVIDTGKIMMNEDF